MKLDINIKNGEIIRIRGPAKIKVVEGQCYIIAKKLSKDSLETISAFRTYSVYSDRDAYLEIELGSGGSIETPGENEEVIYEWLEFASKNVDAGKRFIVIGPIESGKTTISALLSNIALDKGLKPCIIDSDIGQEDIGLPGFIAMSCPNEQVTWLRDLKPQHLRIIGAISPQYSSTRMLSAIYELYNVAIKEKSDVVIVNTDGWVSSPLAIELKFEIARIVNATDIIVMGPIQLYSYLAKRNKSSTFNIAYLKTPKVLKTRSREERRTLRSMAYKKMFEGSELKSIDLKSIVVIGSCLLSGQKLAIDEIEDLSSSLGLEVLYASEHYDSIYVYTEESSFNNIQEKTWRNKNVFIIPRGSEKGLLCSIMDDNLEEKAPCIINEIDFDNNIIKVVTKYSGRIAGIIIGRIKLTTEFEEEVRISKCPI